MTASDQTPEAMIRARQRFAERVAVHGRIVDPAAKRRWNQAHELVRYGLTREQFDRLLEIQRVRGLLCLSCSTAPGLSERTYELARAYLDSPPAQLVVVDAA